MRARYEHLIAHPQEVEAILQAGAHKARALATPFMHTLRRAVGLRPLHTARQAADAPSAQKLAPPSFKQYREADGLFYFKLLDADGALLLQSRGIASPRDAGQAIGRLLAEGAAALEALHPLLQPVADPVPEALQQALERLREANATA